MLLPRAQERMRASFSLPGGRVKSSNSLMLSWAPAGMIDGAGSAELCAQRITLRFSTSPSLLKVYRMVSNTWVLIGGQQHAVDPQTARGRRRTGAAGLFLGRRSGFGCRRLQGKGCAQTYTHEHEEETPGQNSDSPHGFLPEREISRNPRFQLYLRGRLCAGLHTRSRRLQFEIANAP